MVTAIARCGVFVGVLIASLFFLPQALQSHNVYSSFSQIEWNENDSSIELVVHIHSHELETKLSLLLNERLSFLEDSDFPRLEQATGAFLKEKLALQLDGKPVDLLFLGIEAEGQTVYAYLEQDWPHAPVSVEFMNSIFLEDIAGQVNSVLATVGGKRQGGDILVDSGPVKFLF